MLTESVKCPSAGRERGTYMLCHSICLQVGQGHWELYTCTRLPMNPLLRKPNHFRFAMRNCRLRLPVNHSRIYWNRQTYRTISIFAKIYTGTLKLSRHSHKCLFGGKKFQWCWNKRVAYLKLEDLKVLRRSPDLFNNVKIGQGQLQLIMEHILFYHIWGLQTFWSSDLNNLVNNPSNSPVISEKQMFR